MQEIRREDGCRERKDRAVGKRGEREEGGSGEERGDLERRKEGEREGGR